MSIAVLNISRKTIPFIIEKVRLVINNMTGNAAYTTPVPPLATMTSQTDDLETKFQDAINLGKTQKSLMYIALATLRDSARSLTGYVQSASSGDETLILSAGFDVKRTRVPAGILPPPANLRSVFGNLAGEIILRWAGVPKKLFYRVQINDTPGDNTKWKDFAYTAKNRLVATGLISDKVYEFRIASVSADGLGEWSDITSHKAL